MLLVKVKARNVAPKRSIVRKESCFVSVLPSIEEHALGLPLSPDQPYLETAEPLCIAESMTSFSNIPSLVLVKHEFSHLERSPNPSVHLL